MSALVYFCTAVFGIVYVGKLLTPKQNLLEGSETLGAVPGSHTTLTTMAQKVGSE